MIQSFKKMILKKKERETDFRNFKRRKKLFVYFERNIISNYELTADFLWC